MKVYVAGSYQFRVEIAKVIEQIVKAIPTFESTSTWVTQGEEATELNEKGYQHFIDLDRQDIARADAFLLINDYQHSKNSTGKWVEYGIALELGIPIVIWGTAQDSLFLKDKTAIMVASPNVEDLIMVLTAVEKTMAIYKETESYAYRAITRAESRPTRVGTAPGLPEDRGEESSSGVRHREGSPLHDLDRAFARRTQGLGSAQIRAGEATPPHEPSVHHVAAESGIFKP